MTAQEIADRLAAVREKVAQAAAVSGRQPHEVRVLLATKRVPAAAIRAAVEAGCDLIGENRLEEAAAKAPELADLAVERHLIGQLQRKKAGRLAGLVTCVQSIDRLDLARAVAQRWNEPEPLEVFVQVNVSGEESKSGCQPAEALELACQVAALGRLRLRGLMTIASPTDERAQLAGEYGTLRELRDAVLASGQVGTAQAGELSMGMSHDYPIAIAEGATMVRLGTAIFGPRPV